MAYASIDPRMHDDEKFVALDDAAQALWMYLLTGPESIAGPPGLIVIGIAGLAEARRRSTQDIAAALDRLRLAGMIEIDPLHRMIRLPKAPSYRSPGNANVVRGWYRRWTSLPNSQLKFAHLQSMRDALTLCDVADSTRAVFEQTFGADLARRVAFRSGSSIAVVNAQEAPTAAVEPHQPSLPLALVVEATPTADPALEEPCARSLVSGEPFGNGSQTIPEWSIPERIPDRIPEPLRIADEGDELVARLAHELRVERLARVEALRTAGIGASLPAPCLADAVAPGEPARLVRSWVAAAQTTGRDPAEVVRERGKQLLDALVAQAKRELSIASMRETVCYSPKVVDWALATEPAAAGAPRSSGARAAPRAAPRVPDPPPFRVADDERANAASMLPDIIASLGYTPATGGT